jgi:hypothetical protein
LSHSTRFPCHGTATGSKREPTTAPHRRLSPGQERLQWASKYPPRFCVLPKTAVSRPRTVVPPKQTQGTNTKRNAFFEFAVQSNIRYRDSVPLTAPCGFASPGVPIIAQRHRHLTTYLPWRALSRSPRRQAARPPQERPNARARGHQHQQAAQALALPGLARPAPELPSPHVRLPTRDASRC